MNRLVVVRDHYQLAAGFVDDQGPEWRQFRCRPNDHAFRKIKPGARCCCLEDVLTKKDLKSAALRPSRLLAAAAGDRRQALAAQRAQAGVRRRRLKQGAQALRRSVEVLPGKTADSIPKVLAAADALGWLSVDRRVAESYLRVSLASVSPHVDADSRKSLKLLARATFEQLRRESEIRVPRGRRRKLSLARENETYQVYENLLAFFRGVNHRPQPERPRDKHLLSTINAELSRLGAPRRLTMIEFQVLTEETYPNRIAKAAVGAVYGVSPAQVDKIVSRVRSKASDVRQ